MKKIIDYIAEELSEAFEKAGYDRTYGKVTLSNRPDLCEYQCNGAMAGAKAYKKAPFMIAEDVVALLKDSACMEEVEVVKPGFINIRLKKAFVADYLNQMEADEKLGAEEKGLLEKMAPVAEEILKSRLRKTHTHKRTTTNETTLIHINQSVCNRNLPILNFPANVLFINHRV